MTIAGLRRLAVILCIGSASLSFGAPAAALEITGLTATLAGDNSVDVFDNSGNPRTERKSTLGILSSSPGPVADILGNSVEFETRYASLLAVDRESSGGSSPLTQVSHYTIQFTIDDPLNLGYSLFIETDRFGALTLVSDGGGSGLASLAAVVGKLNNTEETGLGLAAATTGTQSASTNTALSQSNSHLANFVGTQAFTLDFLWSLNTTTSGQDEAAIRLGIGGSITAASADDYPGVGPRTAADDGHFVHVTATLLSSPEPNEPNDPGPGGTNVPEPGVTLLLGAAAALGGLRAITRRRR